MAAYHSHLEGLIKARTYQQEVLYRELIEQENLLKIEVNQLNDLTAELEAALERLKKLQGKIGAPGKIQRHYDFIHFQTEKINEQHEIIRAQKECVELKRHELSEVVKEKKIVEKIDTRQRKAFYSE